MLNLNQMSFPDNLLVIEEEPIFVDTKLSASIQKTEAQIEEDRLRRTFRTGKVIAMGKICEDEHSTSFSSATGKKLTVDVGTIVFYSARSVDVNDCPIEYTNQPQPKRPLIFVNRNYIQAIIQE